MGLLLLTEDCCFERRSVGAVCGCSNVIAEAAFMREDLAPVLEARRRGVDGLRIIPASCRNCLEYARQPLSPCLHVVTDVRIWRWFGYRTGLLDKGGS